MLLDKHFEMIGQVIDKQGAGWPVIGGEHRRR